MKQPIIYNYNNDISAIQGNVCFSASFNALSLVGLDNVANINFALFSDSTLNFSMSAERVFPPQKK